MPAKHFSTSFWLISRLNQEQVNSVKFILTNEV